MNNLEAEMEEFVAAPLPSGQSSSSTSDQPHMIICCECGINIPHNPTYLCPSCLNHKYNIAEDIPKEVTIYFCRGCDRYLDPPTRWVVAQLESKELLALCLKKLRGLDKVRLVDASFLYTEPHSRRLQLKVVIQRELDAGGVLQQSFEVEYLIAHQFCSDCHRVEAKDYWKATVQVRQKIEDKRTFYYLEQVMLRQDIGRLTTIIKAVHGGMDLFTPTEKEARRIVDFVSSVVICKAKQSKKLQSHDAKSNVFNYKYSYCLEIAPVCKDSLVCLSKSLARTFGGISPVCIVKRAAKHITLIDPNTAQMAEVNALAYYKSPFKEILSRKQLTKFLVMDIDIAKIHHFKGQGHISTKHTVCDVWVQRESEIGSEKQIFCRTHLGKHLKIGDFVLGYDLQNTNINSTELEKLPDKEVPDVVIIKKFYGSSSERNRKRKWKLRRLDVVDEDSKNEDYMDFLEDLEEDPELRKQINVYKRREEEFSLSSRDQTNDDEDAPYISADEMLDELADVNSDTAEDEDMQDDGN